MSAEDGGEDDRVLAKGVWWIAIILLWIGIGTGVIGFIGYLFYGIIRYDVLLQILLFGILILILYGIRKFFRFVRRKVEK